MSALVIGTRGSALALAQTELVVAALRERYPELQVRVERITTRGDVLTDVPLATLGGNGVFVGAIEDALRAGRIDLAVHSAKDLPSSTPPDLVIAAFMARADPRDVLVSNRGMLRELSAGSTVGTSSQRRACQLRAIRGDLRMVDLRGNVDSRLRQLDAGRYDAIIVAGAGLLRLGLAHRVTEWLPVDVMLPSPGQGALALEVRADNQRVFDLVRPMTCLATELALTAERAFLARLGVGCAAAVAAYATLDSASQGGLHARRDQRLMMRAMIGTADGGAVVSGHERGDPHSAPMLGAALADRLLDAGGREILAASAESVARMPA